MQRTDESRGGSACRTAVYRHTRLVRITHWINAISFLLLIPSGVAILIAHPEFYWGETGYFGDPTALSLPIEPNFDHTAWGRGNAISACSQAASPIGGCRSTAWSLIGCSCLWPN